MEAKKARVFWTGGSQAIRLPKQFRFETDTVLVHREGRAVVVEPADEWPKGYVESFAGVPDDFARPSQGKIEKRMLARNSYVTNTCIYALKQDAAVLGHLRAQSREDIALPVNCSMTRSAERDQVVFKVGSACFGTRCDEPLTEQSRRSVDTASDHAAGLRGRAVDMGLHPVVAVSSRFLLKRALRADSAKACLCSGLSSL